MMHTHSMRAIRKLFEPNLPGRLSVTIAQAFTAHDENLLYSSDEKRGQGPDFPLSQLDREIRLELSLISRFSSEIMYPSGASFIEYT